MATDCRYVQANSAVSFERPPSLDAAGEYQHGEGTASAEDLRRNCDLNPLLHRLSFLGRTERPHMEAAAMHAHDRILNQLMMRAAACSHLRAPSAGHFRPCWIQRVGCTLTSMPGSGDIPTLLLLLAMKADDRVWGL